MPEKCPYCKKEFTNTKALGSHIHYLHENIHIQDNRSEADKERFHKLLGSCITDFGLKKPRNVEKIEQAITEIPAGIDTDLDQYREAHKCAKKKEKILNEFIESIAMDTINEAVDEGKE